MTQLPLSLRFKYANVTRADMFASNAFWQSTPLPIVIQMAAPIQNDWGQEERSAPRFPRKESPAVT